MTVYADASLIVSAFTTEPASIASREWLASLAPGSLIASKWCETEVASALALKVRTGVLSSDIQMSVFRAVRDMIATSATVVRVDAVHFDRAAELLGLSRKPLRGGDALHLAIAAAMGATLFTLDRKMAEAGIALGLDVHLLA